VITRARLTRQNCQESYANDGAVESQYQAFHRSLRISENRRFPHFHSSGGGLFYRTTEGPTQQKLKPFTQKSDTAFEPICSLNSTPIGQTAARWMP